MFAGKTFGEVFNSVLIAYPFDNERCFILKSVSSLCMRGARLWVEKCVLSGCCRYGRFAVKKDAFPLDCLTRRIFEKLHPDVKWRLCEILSQLWRGLGRVMTRTKHGRHLPEARLLRGVCGVNLCLIDGFVGRKVSFALFSGGRRVGKIGFSFLFQVSIFCYRAGG